MKLVIFCKKLLFVLLFFILSYNNLYAQLTEKYDSDYDWQTIKTQNFKIHYHQGLHDVALRLSVIAEEIHLQLVPKIGWKPESKTDVVLVDSMDLANGYATPIPANRVQIYMSRPDFGYELSNFDDWLYSVFLHEYVHILNLDTVHFIGSGLRKVFGRNFFTFPNVMVPIFMLEGNAVYHESGDGKSGRLNSNYVDMIMRTEILADQFKSIDKAAFFTREWPMGSVSYLYGGYFVKFLEDKYGTGSFAKLFHENGENCFPYSDNIYFGYFYNKDVKDVFNKSYPSLWEDFEKYMNAKFLAQISAIKKNKLTEYKIISDKEVESKYPRFDKNNNIYYIQSSPYTGNRLFKYSKDKDDHEELCKVSIPESLSVANDGKIFISDVELYKSYSIYNEAFVYDSSYSQITSRLRGKAIDVFNNNQNVIYIKNNLDKYSLIKSDINFKEKNPIIENSNVQIANSRISPDNKKIIFTIKDLNGNADLVLYNISNKSFQRLTNDTYKNINPCWHPDNNRIVFSSDKSGVYNLYEYNLTNKTISRLTNVVGGAFNPDVSDDGKLLVFSSYGAKGHVVSLLNYPTKKIQTSKAVVTSLNKNFFYNEKQKQAVAEQRKALKVTDYNVLESILPTAWYPVFYSEQISPDKYDQHLGAIFFTTDILYKHAYQLTLDYAVKQKKASVIFDYIYSALYPDLFLGYYDNAIFFSDDEFPFEDTYDEVYTRDLNRIGYLGFIVPYSKINYQHMLQMSYMLEREYVDKYFPDNTHQEYEINNARIQGIYYFNNSTRYLYSISNEAGIDFIAIGDYYHKIYNVEYKNFEEEIGAEKEYYKARAELNAYIPFFFDNNVIRYRMRGGICRNNFNKQPYRIGRFIKGETGAIATDEDQFGLRGYAGNKLYGNKIATATFEYKFPVIQKDFGIYTFPLMFRDIWINVFGEAGAVWHGYNYEDDTRELVGRKFENNYIKKSAGIELHSRFTLFYQLDLFANIGFARGFDELGEDQVYFSVSTLLGGFEGAKQRKIKKINSY